MSIHFDAAAQIFHLKTAHSSYAMQVAPSGHLAHLYFGAPLREATLSYLMDAAPDRAFSPETIPGNRVFSLDTLPQEFPAYGGSDFRAPAIEVQMENGSTVSEFLYRAHRIFDGKPRLEGLPATYVEAETEAQTLEIELFDAVSGLEVTLSYSAFESIGAIARNVRVRNAGQESLRLNRILSASLDFPNSDAGFLQLSGAWAREREISTTPLRPGSQFIESRRGASSADHNPFFALLANGAGEENGEVYGFNLVYSGSFTAGVEVAPYGTARAQIGINPFDFSYFLEAGESFQAPEAILVYSGRGLGEMSRIFGRLYRTRLCRGVWRDKERPILINSWEANYFDISEAKILALGATAAKLGIELLVMDDGWFGKRDNDKTSLGDWFVHAEKFPDGLAPLAQKINAMGLEFGLWFEPEMISPDSELYRAHPDWCLHVPNRRRTTGRNQLILDLSRPEVGDYIVKVVGDILQNVPIGYVKWDMNRHMTEIGSAGLPPHRQRETAHLYILGLYRVLETLTARFPDVLFESCSGGGGRFDPGMLFYMPQTWTSDNTDAIARLKIQYGTSMVYPASAMGAHISDSPNHFSRRQTPLETRGAVAMSGNFGYELDLNRLSEAELATMKTQVALYKELRPIVQNGEFYRLKSPFEGNETAWIFVSQGQNEALLCQVQVLTTVNGPLSRLKLRGLDAARDYEIEILSEKGAPQPQTLGGDVLMNAGLAPVRGGDFQARLWRLRAVN